MIRSILVICLLALAPVAALAQSATPNFDRALEQVGTRDFQSAVESFTKAIDAKERLDGSYFNRALCYSNMKEWQKSKNDLDRSIELAPDNATSYVYRAMASANLQDVTGAMNDVNQAIKLDPTLGKAYTLRGQIYANTGEKDKACSDFQKGVELKDPIAIKMSEAICGTSQEDESLTLHWPEAENWRIANHQKDANTELYEMLRDNESLDSWTELGQVMSINGAAQVPVDTLMSYMYEEAVKRAPKSKLTFIEHDLRPVNPWVIFTIESPEFESDPNPESQLWYVTTGKTSAYTCFRAIKKASIPQELRAKWTEFFKTGKVVTLPAAKN